MTKKYELMLDDTATIGETTLYRIKALRSFGDVEEGDRGGYIASEDNLSHDGECWVYDFGKVHDLCRVSESGKVKGNAQMHGFAQVYGNGILDGECCIFDNVQVYDNGEVRGTSKLFDRVQVYGDAKVKGDSVIHGNVQVYNDAILEGVDVSYGIHKCHGVHL